MKEKIDESSVTEANRRFYDTIARVYESVDSRRNQADQHDWLIHLLDEIKNKLKQNDNGRADNFIDIGAGTGFLALQASRIFSQVHAADISKEMLGLIRDPKIHKILAPADRIPLADSSMDCVGAFATLHHLFDPSFLFNEAKRLLRSGGILYTDHDISSEFVRRFRWPLNLYRRLFDHGDGYLDACPTARASDYKLSEFHGEAGLGGQELKLKLLSLGFKEVKLELHWQGMGPFAKIESLCPKRILRRPGNSPILRLIAVK
jgi:ubiquinone/menaquinone biosynthesis C-methylase UbiE